MRGSVLCKLCSITGCLQNQGELISSTSSSYCGDHKLDNKFTVKVYNCNTSCAPKSSSGVPYGIKSNSSVFPILAETVCLQDTGLHEALHRPQFSPETREDRAWPGGTCHQEATWRYPPEASTTERPRQPLSDPVTRPSDSGCNWWAEGPQQHYLKAWRMPPSESGQIGETNGMQYTVSLPLSFSFFQPVNSPFMRCSRL